jgi:hypothetical protein
MPGFLIHLKKQRAMAKTEAMAEAGTKAMAEEKTEDLLSTGPKDPWIHITDEMIRNVGYRSSTGNKSHHRSHLFQHLKKTFIKNKDYRVSSIQTTSTGRGGHNKKKLEMTQSAYQKLLQSTYKLRDTGKPNAPCFLYILHNPVFQYYGPNVYKVGFSCDPSRHKNDGSAMLLDESTILYQKQVPSKQYERKLHKLLAKNRIKKNREFFDCPFDVIKETMDSLYL